MKKILFFLLIIIGITSCKKKFTMSYTIDDVQIEENDLRLFISYTFSNYGNTIWLYDHESGNDLQYIDSYIENGNAIISFYVVKPESKDGWYASWGYNANFPKFIKIEKNNAIQGKWILSFSQYDKREINNYIFDYLISYRNFDDTIFTINDLREYQNQNCERIKIIIGKKQIEKFLESKEPCGYL